MQPEKINIDKEMNLFHSRLKEKNLKITSQRNELAKWIFQVHEHFTVDDVVESFRRVGKKISVATVYRIVETMLDLNLLIEHDFGKGQKYYEHTPGHEHHDHMICNQCGKIIEFVDENLEALKDEIARNNGFKMESHALHIFGLCDTCQAKNKSNLTI